MPFQTIIDAPGHRVRVRIHGRIQPRARIVAATMLGRELRSDEIVHHIDENPNNDAPENLQVVTRAEHNRLHHPGVDIPQAVCHGCGAQFATNARQRRWLRADLDARVFCSPGCYRSWARAPQTTRAPCCAACGTAFVLNAKQRRRLAADARAAVFCGRDCYRAWWRS